MPAKKVEATGVIYQIKVTLLDSDPPIWRRLLVPATLSLKQFHAVLQIAMGWQNAHLHEFVAGGRRFGIPDPEEPGLATCLDHRKFRLSEVLPGAGAEARYDYDFGDNWRHAVIVEQVLPAEGRRRYPYCVDGEMHGPPEDCGGIPGFYGFLEAIRDPKHLDHYRLLDWVGGRFDARAFSSATVNRKLRLLKIGQKRAAPKRKPVPDVH